MVDVELVRGDQTISLSGLSRESFPEPLWDVMPNCQEGFDEYVRLGMRRPALRWSRAFWVAKVAGEVAGYAEWSDLGRVRFLNHICTRPSMQGLGVARALIQAPHDSSRQRIELDVFDSEPAFTFYQHLGLRAMRGRCWHLRSAVNVSREGPGGLVSDAVADFENGMRTFGFSRLHITWRDRSVTVSFPSARLARLPNLIDFEDDELLTAIKAAVPSIKRFAWISSPNASSVRSESLLTSSRFSGYLPPPTSTSLPESNSCRGSSL